MRYHWLISVVNFLIKLGVEAIDTGSTYFRQFIHPVYIFTTPAARPPHPERKKPQMQQALGDQT